MLVGIVAFNSCSEDKEPVFVKANAVPSTLNAIDGSYVLSASSSDFTTFTFSKTDFGIAMATIYALEASIDESFATYSQLGTTTTSGSMVISAETMNSALLGWDVEAGTAATVYFRVKASAMDESSQATDMFVCSNVISSSITPYSGDRVYPMVYVIGGFNGWSDDTTQKLYCFEEDDKNYQGVIDFGTLAADGFKIKGTATGWDDSCNWGVDGSSAGPDAEASSVQLISSGGSGNISCYSQRFYRFNFNKTDLVLSMNLSFNNLYLVGSDAGIGWDTATGKPMNFDTVKQRFYLDYTFAADAEIKFLTTSNLWLGDAGGGKLGDGGNIKVSAGSYRIYVNLNNSANQTFELNADDFEAAE